MDYNNSTSLHNWVETLNLTCVPGSKMGFIGASYFIGWTATCLIIPPLADRIGRKYVYRVALTLNIFAMIGLVLSRSLNLTIGIITFIGVITAGRILVGYVYACDFLTPKWRILYGTLNITIDGTTTLWAALYFDFVSKRAIYFECFGILLAIMALVLHCILVPESPFWLLKKGKLDEGRAALERVFAISKTDPDFDDLFDEVINPTRLNFTET